MLSTATNHPSSRPKIRLMPIQRPTEPPSCGYKDHAWKASANYHRSRRGRLGGCQLYGGEEVHCDRYG